MSIKRAVTEDVLNDMFEFISEHASSYDDVKYKEIRDVMSLIDTAIDTPYSVELKEAVDTAQEAVNKAYNAFHAGPGVVREAQDELDAYTTSNDNDPTKLVVLDNALTNAKIALEEATKTVAETEKILFEAKTARDEAKKAQDDAYLPLIQKYGELAGDFQYKLTLTKPQYLSLKNLIYKKFVYDRETILVGVAVKNYIKTYDNQDNERTTNIKFDNNNEFVFDFTISDLARLIQSTSTYKLPGLDGDAENFATIMSKIIVLSKISEVFKTIGNGYKNDYDNKMSTYELGL